MRKDQLEFLKNEVARIACRLRSKYARYDIDETYEDASTEVKKAYAIIKKWQKEKQEKYSKITRLIYDKEHEIIREIVLSDSVAALELLKEFEKFKP